MPAMGTGGIQFDPAGQPGLLDHRTGHALRRRGSADVAHADEKNFLHFVYYQEVVKQFPADMTIAGLPLRRFRLDREPGAGPQFE